jgi:hypothetical protein
MLIAGEDILIPFKSYGRGEIKNYKIMIYTTPALFTGGRQNGLTEENIITF